MGQQQSKDELLFRQVSYGNAEGIKELHSKGAGLEWIDREGKTPLIVSCMNPELLNVTRTLIELGANLNAYRPGRQGGTPLHHAAKRGLEHTVKLLLSHGANALVMNDDCQTPLDVARAKGFSNVVRAIESHICLFSGWLREFHGPGFLGALAPQLVSRKVWVVVLPCGARTPTKPFKLELAIYPSLQDARPRTAIALWKANMDEPNFDQPDPVVIVVDNSSISRGRRRRRNLDTCHGARFKGRVVRQTRIKLAAPNESDKQQLQLFCNACKGITQGTYPAFLHNTSSPVAPATAPPPAEDLELAMAINASIQSAMQRPPLYTGQTSSEANASTSWNNTVDLTSQSGCSGPVVHEDGPSQNLTEHVKIESNTPDIIQTTHETFIPSAPLLSTEIMDEGPIHYPSIDCNPVDLTAPVLEKSPGGENEKKGDGSASSCVICLDAPVEGACIPCGHMAGCMSCLNEIKAKKWGCPVCRSKIEQIIRLYAV